MFSWEKFDADSPQYSDVGKARYHAWFYTDPESNYKHTKRQMFDDHDKSELIDFMWHELRALEAQIHDRDRKIKELENNKVIQNGRIA